MNRLIPAGITVVLTIAVGIMADGEYQGTPPTKQELFRQSVFHQNHIWCAKPENKHYCTSPQPLHKRIGGIHHD